MTSLINKQGTTQPSRIRTYLAIAAVAVCGVAFAYKSINAVRAEEAARRVMAQQEALDDAEIKDIKQRLTQASMANWETCVNAAGPEVANASDHGKTELARLRRIESCMNQLKQPR